MNTDFAETMKNTNQLIGCCGLDREKCDARIATITNDNALHGGNFTKVCENADGSLLKTGEWLFTGDDIVQLSQKDNWGSDPVEPVEAIMQAAGFCNR